MSSFDYLIGKSEYQSVYDACVIAESEMDSTKKALLCRDALEIVIDLIYTRHSVQKPEMATMLELIDGDVVGSFFASDIIINSAHFIRKLGSNASHQLKIKKTQAKLAFDNLAFVVRYTYSKFDDPSTITSLVLPKYMSEATTRKIYIDLYLEEAGWEVVPPNDSRKISDGTVIQCGTPIATKACCEIPVEGMSNKSGVGFCDYVLYGRNGHPLAIVEAKKTSENATKGSYQVKEYGECMKRKYGYVPILYYTNGYEIYVIDGLYPARKVMAFHSLDELDRMLERRNREDMSDLHIRDDISGRPYQKIAVTKVCEHFNKLHRRSLLVMATGTGKTRVSISIVELMIRNNWITNVLFLADRTSLVSQAFDNFRNILPEFNFCVLSDPNQNADKNARVCFSTHQTMINYIDAENKEFTIGRFDLIIVDEAHRSIFNKYGSIFKYFDALLVGLTATPKDEVDASTYEIFNCENGEPDYAYSIEEAVQEHYLVPYRVKNRKTKLLTSGAKYGDLSYSDRMIVDSINEDLLDDDFELKREEFFSKYYNIDTCSKVLDDLMVNGLKVDGGQKIGKTIIFAYNHKHAEMIVDTFKKDFPYNDDYCQLIDNKVKHADKLIRAFDTDENFRIAVSVDMLDTGVDVPSVLNLVFFKPVKSKIKFVQMIGRGTRLCPNLIDGANKTHFLIFDYCGNFEYFKMSAEGDEGEASKSLSQRLFDAKLDLLVELQSYRHQTDPFSVQCYLKWKEELYRQVADIKNSSSRISVREEMPFVDKYCDYERWTALALLDKKEMQLHISHLIANEVDEEVGALRFDLKMFQIEKSFLTEEKSANVARQIKNVRVLSKLLLETKATQPAVKSSIPVLLELSSSEYWNRPDMQSLEKNRQVVRDLLIYLPSKAKPVDVNIDDDIIEGENIDDYTLIDIRTYKDKVIDYLAENTSNATIMKIRNLEQIDANDLKELERILWQELGSKEDYDRTTSIANLAAFIRSIVGIEPAVVNRKFGEFLNENVLNSQQMEFVKSIIDYVRQNGDIRKEDLLDTSPFDHYDMLALFGTNISIVTNIVDQIHNSICAA
ncbi:MAG: DEAD/DEAH box helicase family protein [Clostridiales bacterium]|nr:DEAD/DEAH box helicase family protein [Candidatus Scatonaster coprocaballi]